MPDPIFLPGVPEDRLRAIFAAAAGNEIASGKFASPQSSAAFAANGFGWFLDRPAELPMFPPLADIAGPVDQVEIERQVRFPWSGGRHPWLDAVVHTGTHLIGVESKRFEPFRDRKAAALSVAYDRDVWGDDMVRWSGVRDMLRREPRRYVHLDAAQLVKHAYGLRTEGMRIGKAPVLLYLFAEPTSGMGNPADAMEKHRQEIADVASMVAGDEVRFASCSWREWLAVFENDAADHADRVEAAFAP